MLTRRTPAARTKALIAALTVAATLSIAERRASAQACCIAPGAAGVTRLAPHETALAGMDARAQTTTGTFDAAGRYRTAPQGTRDIGLEQSLFATVRVLERGQLSATVPFIQTVRSTEALTATGGGIGDVRGSVRWDLAFADDAWPWPGLALIGGVSAPTGRPPERAGDALGAGATGTGTTQGWAGVALEQTSGPWLAGANATVTVRPERDVGQIRVSSPPRFAAGLVGARAWRSGHALSLAASWEIEDRASGDGIVVPGSARRALRIVSALQLRLGESARFVGSVYAIPPLPAVTAGEGATLGLSLALVHPWS
jgi:hypothetical protein